MDAQSAFLIKLVEGVSPGLILEALEMAAKTVHNKSRNLIL